MIKTNRLLLLFFIFFSSALFSQVQENPFRTSENEKYENVQKNDNQFAPADHEVDENTQNFGPPGDDDTVPIDSYIPFLIVTASAIIIYFGRKKRTIET